MREIKTYLLILIFSLTLNVVNAKEKIVSAGGSVTEILFELGLGTEIIAVDSSSTFPLEMTKLPQIGYFRSLSAEGLLALNPTIIVASNGAGPDETLAQIQQTGVKVKVFKPEVYTLSSWEKHIYEVADYFNLKDKADVIVSNVNENLKKTAQVNESAGETKSKIKAIFLLGLGERGPIAGGQNTVPNMLFKLANLDNIVTGFEGFKPYSTESFIKNKPDLIVMPAHVVEKLGGKKTLCESMIIKLATAHQKNEAQEVKNNQQVHQTCNLLVMDPLLALGFGTRIDQAVKVLSSYVR